MSNLIIWNLIFVFIYIYKGKKNKNKNKNKNKIINDKYLIYTFEINSYYSLFI